MNEIIINSCDDLLKKINDSGNVFRGCSDSTYKLIPAIGRMVNEDLTLEKKVLEQFSEHANLKITNNKQIWEVLFLAQHYGVLTRLLDWTLDPLVALYFAVRKKKKKKFAIFCLNVPILEETPSFSPFKTTETIFIKPKFTDNGISNQKSILSIQKNFTTPILNSNLTKFIFEPKLQKDILNLCNNYGINEKYLLPDGLKF